MRKQLGTNPRGKRKIRYFCMSPLQTYMVKTKDDANAYGSVKAKCQITRVKIGLNAKLLLFM